MEMISKFISGDKLSKDELFEADTHTAIVTFQKCLDRVKDLNEDDDNYPQQILNDLKKLGLSLTIQKHSIEFANNS